MSILKKQLPINLLLNACHFGLNLIIGLWLTPYFVHMLGLAAYGLIPLSLIISEYIALLTNSVNGAVARYLTIAIQKEQWNEANRIFSTAFFSLLGIVLFSIPCLGWVSFNIHRLIKVPPELLHDATLLFGLTFAGFLASILSSIFSSSLYAKNRLDLCRIIDIARLLLRLGLVVTLFSFHGAHLSYVGYANFLSGIVSLVIGARFSMRINPLLKIRIRSVDPSQFRELISFGGWTVLAQFGGILFARMDLLLVNWFFGPESTGKLGALLQWSTVIQGLAALLAGVCAPLIVILYAREQQERLVSVTRFAVKTMALLIAIPAGLICGFSKPLLVLWLGAAFEPQARLLILTMLPMVIVSSVTPLYAVQIAYNKLRFPATAMVVIGLVKFPLVIALCMTKQLDLNGICLIGGVIWVIKCVYTNLLYNAKLLKVPSMTFVTPVIWGVLLQAGVWAMAYLCSVIGIAGSWTMLIGSGLGVAGVGAAVAWIFCYDHSDRSEIRSVLSSINALRFLRPQVTNASS